MSTEVETREELHAELSARMHQTYQQRLKKEKNDKKLVKSYLIESHLNGQTTRAESMKNFIDRRLNHASKTDLQVIPLKSDGLFAIKTIRKQTESTAAKELSTIYIDCLKDRFWRCHTLSDAAEAEKTLNTLCSLGPEIDKVWFRGNDLEEISHFGELRSLKLFHQRLRNSSHDQYDDETGNRADLVLELKGTQFVTPIFDFLRKENTTKDYASLSHICIKNGEETRRNNYQDDDDENEQPNFSIDDVRYDGKFTTRGTDFTKHTKLLESCLSKYRNMVLTVEKSIIQIQQNSICGTPLIFHFGSKQDETELLCEKIFNSKDPFRLFGLKSRIGKNAFRVSSTDLHSGGNLQFEIFPDFIRMFLYPGCCGNSVFRFQSNLERHVSARVQLQDNRGNAIEFNDAYDDESYLKEIEPW